MTKVVGVRFRNVGKIYYFSPKDYEIKTGDHVIVETARGIEYGKVVLAPREVGEEDVVHPLKEVLRVATKEDDEREAQNRVREREAFKICQKKIREHGLEMKLIDAEYTFDNNKVLFYTSVFSFHASALLHRKLFLQRLRRWTDVPGTHPGWGFFLQIL